MFLTGTGPPVRIISFHLVKAHAVKRPRIGISPDHRRRFAQEDSVFALISTAFGEGVAGLATPSNRAGSTRD
jgi:hypothetical protein